MLTAYAQKYFKHIVNLLGEVPSDMLLLLKTNDCLRHLDRKLQAPVNSIQGEELLLFSLLSHGSF